jgi:hypothetical protein
MLEKEEVVEIVEAFQKGEATLGEVYDAFEDWDGDPAEIL